MAAELLTRYRPVPTYTSMAPLSAGLALLLLITSTVSGVGSTCPSDVIQQANTCFSDYNREFQNLQSSPKRLCCGVDVETLRAFCRSFVDAMSCIHPLKKRCPRTQAIDDSMKNLHGAETSLKALCSDDTIIERYALHQSCITRTGGSTERCFQRFLNTTDTIKLMTSVETRHISEFCSDMRGTLQCIQTNVRQSCGKVASELVTKLVKPMVRQSTKCNYNVVTKAPVSRQGQPSPSSHDGSWQGPDSGSGLAGLSSALLTVCVAVTARTFLLSS
ncbi:uncharacterized protein LOC143284759 [Babylonia areolata]|uniref:uncharacterized protein LOC143284759 n=1 Tax=Babylonia areolata TaxID=304850 RepID=UPI003FD620A9